LRWSVCSVVNFKLTAEAPISNMYIEIVLRVYFDRSGDFCVRATLQTEINSAGRVGRNRAGIAESKPVELDIAVIGGAPRRIAGNG